MNTFIYTLSDKTGIRYLGKSNDPNNRLKDHLKKAKYKRTRKEKWLYSILEKNEFPILDIVDEVPIENWIFYEQKWIKKLKDDGFDLVNGTIGGEGGNAFKGKKHTEETIKKCREAGIKSGGYSSPGSKNGRSKLKEFEVLEIKKLIKEKISYTKIAKQFMISKITICYIANGKRWNHIN